MCTGRQATEEVRANERADAWVELRAAKWSQRVGESTE